MQVVNTGATIRPHAGAGDIAQEINYQREADYQRKTATYANAKAQREEYFASFPGGPKRAADTRQGQELLLAETQAQNALTGLFGVKADPRTIVGAWQNKPMTVQEHAQWDLAYEGNFGPNGALAQGDINGNPLPNGIGAAASGLANAMGAKSAAAQPAKGPTLTYQGKTYDSNDPAQLEEARRLGLTQDSFKGDANAWAAFQASPFYVAPAPAQEGGTATMSGPAPAQGYADTSQQGGAVAAEQVRDTTAPMTAPAAFDPASRLPQQGSYSPVPNTQPQLMERPAPVMVYPTAPAPAQAPMRDPEAELAARTAADRNAQQIQQAGGPQPVTLAPDAPVVPGESSYDPNDQASAARAAAMYGIPMVQNLSPSGTLIGSGGTIRVAPGGVSVVDPKAGTPGAPLPSTYIDSERKVQGGAQGSSIGDDKQGRGRSYAGDSVYNLVVINNRRFAVDPATGNILYEITADGKRDMEHTGFNASILANVWEEKGYKDDGWYWEPPQGTTPGRLVHRNSKAGTPNTPGSVTAIGPQSGPAQVEEQKQKTPEAPTPVTDQASLVPATESPRKKKEELYYASRGRYTTEEAQKLFADQDYQVRPSSNQDAAAGRARFAKYTPEELAAAGMPEAASALNYKNQIASQERMANASEKRLLAQTEWEKAKDEREWPFMVRKYEEDIATARAQRETLEYQLKTALPIAEQAKLNAEISRLKVEEARLGVQLGRAQLRAAETSAGRKAYAAQLPEEDRLKVAKDYRSLAEDAYKSAVMQAPPEVKSAGNGGGDWTKAADDWALKHDDSFSKEWRAYRGYAEAANDYVPGKTAGAGAPSAPSSGSGGSAVSADRAALDAAIGY